MATHKVMPSFLDHLHAYGRKGNGENDALFGGGRYKLEFSPAGVAGYELCYTLKFGVKNGRKPDSDPGAWSIRQSSVYQKFHYDSRKAAWILVQPSDMVQKRLPEVTGSSELSTNPLKTHLLFLSAAGEGWRDFYNHLEAIFYDTTKAAVHWTVQRNKATFMPHSPTFQGNVNPLELFEVDFDDVQKLQRFEENLRRVRAALEVNEDSIRSVKALNEKLHELMEDDHSSKGSFCEIDAEAEQQLTIINRHKRNFESLLQNVRGRAALLYNVLEFKNALAVSQQAQRSVDIKALQQNEVAMRTVVSEMSMRDAIGVKILTLLATLYIPASFVAVSLTCLSLKARFSSQRLTSVTDFHQTFLSAGIVTFNESLSERKSIDFKRVTLSKESIIIYVLFTVMLMVLTYGSWWFWYRKAERQTTKKLMVSRQNSLEPEKRMRINSGMDSVV